MLLNIVCGQFWIIPLIKTHYEYTLENMYIFKYFTNYYTIHREYL